MLWRSYWRQWRSHTYEGQGKVRKHSEKKVKYNVNGGEDMEEAKKKKWKGIKNKYYVEINETENQEEKWAENRRQNMKIKWINQNRRTECLDW
jgi:hypothetical protein